MRIRSFKMERMKPMNKKEWMNQSKSAHNLCMFFCLLLMILPVSLQAQAPNGVVGEVSLLAAEWKDYWECREDAWIIDQEGTLTCQMEEVLQKNGKKRVRGMGYLWTRDEFSDFVLDVEYRLSPQANSGIFFRADPEDPVQDGFEIQLLDDSGILQAGGKLNAKKLNAALYDCQSPSMDVANPAGEWNELRLTCRGSFINVELNQKIVNQIDLRRWTDSKRNPDGTANKFERPLSKRRSAGRIGFQNHGKQVWFRNVRVTPLNL